MNCYTYFYHSKTRCYNELNFWKIFPCVIAGYNVGDRGCCGTGKIEVTFLCNHLDPTCPNVLDYVFWDSFHPTESVYRNLVPRILQKYMYQLFN